MVNTENRQVVYSYHPDVPRLVASNMKLLTTWVALQILHPDFRWHTKLFYTGQIVDHVLHGDVYIQGGGDPTFDEQALYELVSSLKYMSVDEVEGNVIIDQHIFNSKPTYSMLEVEKYDSDTILPSGFMVNGDAAEFTLYIKPHNVMITHNLYGYTVNNQLKIDDQQATCSNVYKNVQVNLHGDNVLFTGNISAKCDGKVLAYSMLNHEAYSTIALTNMFHTLNIKLDGGYDYVNGKNTIPLSATLAIDHSSNSLAQIIYTMNHDSVNLIAESLLLSLGAYTSTNIDTYQQSKAIMNNYIKKMQWDNDKFKLENGAGLSRSEYLTANALGQLLWRAGESPLQAVFQASLPMGGEEGTLHNKFIDFGDRVQLKTGTLKDTKSFAGYFYAKNGVKYIVVMTVNLLNYKNGSDESDRFNSYTYQLLSALDQRQ